MFEICNTFLGNYKTRRTVKIYYFKVHTVRLLAYYLKRGYDRIFQILEICRIYRDVSRLKRVV